MKKTILIITLALISITGFSQNLSSLLGVVVKPAGCKVIPEPLDIAELFHIRLRYDSRFPVFYESSPGPDDIAPAVGKQDHYSLLDITTRIAIDD